MAIGENGGAESIRKFNYQHSVAMMFLISNLGKTEFAIFPELIDDLMVETDNHRIDVQVKGTDSGLTINSLHAIRKGKQKSIIYKSLEAGEPDDYRIIVFWNISKPQRVNYDETQFPLEIFDDTVQVLKLNHDNVSDIRQRYSVIDEIEHRTEKHYFVKTPFEATIPAFKQWLISKIVDLDFVVEKGIIETVFDVLLSIIAQKSELKMDGESGLELKRIDKSILDQFLVTRDESQLFDKILSKLQLPALAEQKIMDCKLSVDTLNSSFLNELEVVDFNEDFEWLDDRESVELVIDEIEKMLGAQSLEKADKYAIAITFLSRK